MSDLGGGRTSNGGPVPVSSTSVPAGLKTPRDVMRDRRAREARRQEETKLEEQRRRQQEEERRKSAERRAAAATGEPRFSAASSQYTPDVSAQQGAFQSSRLSGSGQVASGADYGVPTGRMSASEAAYQRRAGPTSQSQDQPRPAPTASSSRRTQAQPSSKQQASQAQASSSYAQPQPSVAGAADSQEPRSSTFPHAFERWEQLSSHWEGMTSYWLRKLQANTEEISATVPTASAMSRQITDLSAAGANLFHAVVELQRLRASSERKFQRWFFETRADTERNQEIRAQLEQQLQGERTERQRAAKERVDVDIAAENARREVAEMRRELMISKEEARRAWEELGRRNQESLELAESLKAGKMTIVSGMQVLPIFSGPSRTASASQRPATRDGVQQYEATPGINTAGAAGLRSPGDDDYYEQGESPTNTDPFVESRPALHHEPGVQSLATGTYQPSFQATSGPLPSQPAFGSPSQRPSSAGHQATPRATQQQLPIVSAADAEHFYQQAPQNTYLHTPSAAGQRRPKQDDPEYQSEEEDWDAEADPQHQRELAQHYGSAAHPTALTQIPPEAPTVPATSAAAMANFGPTSGAAPQRPASLGAEPDYEGGGYDGWEHLGARNTHHPTRLSDVLEEDEERSSRRTAE